MKSFARLTVVGLSGAVLFKLFTSILIPMLGLFLGLIALTVKIALIAAVVFFLYSILTKKSRDIEVEIDVDEVQDVEEVPEADVDDPVDEGA